MVEDVAQAVLAVAQGVVGSAALDHLALQLGGALVDRFFDAPGAARHEQQQRAQQRSGQQASHRKRPGVRLLQAGHLTRVGGDAQLPVAARKVQALPGFEDRRGACQLARRQDNRVIGPCAFTAGLPSQPGSRCRRVDVDQTPGHVAVVRLQQRAEGAFGVQRDEDHPLERRDTLGVGACRAAVQRLVEHNAGFIGG